MIWNSHFGNLVFLSFYLQFQKEKVYFSVLHFFLSLKILVNILQKNFSNDIFTSFSSFTISKTFILILVFFSVLVLQLCVLEIFMCIPLELLSLLFFPTIYNVKERHAD